MATLSKVEGTKVGDVDFMGESPTHKVTNEIRQLRLAENVLSSYSHGTDFLAEPLQNATDAVDIARARDPSATARIDIRIDAAARSIEITDTGIGMSIDDLRVVLTPNVTLKSGRLARSGSTRSRGEKGVGLTFLALACDYLRIETSTGSDAHTAVVEGAHRWVATDGKAAKPMARLSRIGRADRLGSPSYTVVRLQKLATDQFDVDLFALPADELAWMIRTRTAIGHTGNLFRKARGKAPEDNIEVTFTYIDPHGAEFDPMPLPYLYASPEELVAKEVIVDFDDASKLSAGEQSVLLRGGALRYAKEHYSATGRRIALYVFVIDGREMQLYERAAAEARRYFPEEWQGFYVSARDMPTGVRVVPDIHPRTYQRRLFGLLQYDELVLDLGRKTLAGRTNRMLRDIIEEAWSRHLQAITPRVQPRMGVYDAGPLVPASDLAVSPTQQASGRSRQGSSDLATELQRRPPPPNTLAEAYEQARREGWRGSDPFTVARAALKLHLDRALKAQDLRDGVPYLKVPTSRTDVLSLLHEMLGAGSSALPHIRTIQSGVFAGTDSLVYLGSNTERALHVLIGLDARDILADLERDDLSGHSADVGIVWRIDLNRISRRGVDVEPTDGDPLGSTHRLLLRGVGDREEFPIIVLETLLDGPH